MSRTARERTSPILERNYTVDDDTPESEPAYALCYKCHQRTSILSDASFSEHRRHIVEERTPCAVCHDPHGIALAYVVGSDHTHLINFDLRSVRPEPQTQRIAYRDLGSRTGSCTLLCHGATHLEQEYGTTGVTLPEIRTRARTRGAGR